VSRRTASWIANDLSAAALAVAAVVLLCAAPAVAAHGGAKASRRANPRTGRLSPALAELVKAAKRGDRAALGRVADRLGPARLGPAIASADPAVGQAALAAVPLARGGVLLVAAVAAELWAADPARAGAAATALGVLLDGASPTELEDWDVPSDAIAQACDWLKALAAKSSAPLPVRLAALDASAAAAPTCGAPADLGPLVHDPAPAIRRAAVLIAAVGEHRGPLLRDAIADADRAVSATAAATACRVELRTDRAGKVDPPDAAALAAARSLAGAATTPPEDGVEMLDCPAAARQAADRALLEELQRRPPSPLRDRAVELGGGAGH
jgi:hypothetical protein